MDCCLVSTSSNSFIILKSAVESMINEFELVLTMFFSSFSAIVSCSCICLMVIILLKTVVSSRVFVLHMVQNCPSFCFVFVF